MQLPDLHYRPHIDGLRAIAVLSVVLFHLDSSLFPGGYLGVDIFFVISGFVITQSLYKDHLSRGRISIYHFYLKRIKRLYPALVFMVLGTTIAYTLFGFLWDTNLFLKSALTSILAVSNLYFLYHGDNYFQQDLVNPLVHTWSLGVEEQFYFIYPIFLLISLLVARKLKVGSQTLALVFLILTVLLFLAFFNDVHPAFSMFYSPLARFWELGAGCTLFFFLRHYSFILFSGTVTLVSLVGLGSVLVLKETIADLRIETFLAVGFTVLIIASGTFGDGIADRLLRNKMATYLGKLSYSLYLWHLPVIYFASLYLSGWFFWGVSLLVSLGLAVFSYHQIEKPFRYSDRLDPYVTFFFKSLPVGAVAAVVLIMVVGVTDVRKVINIGFNDTGAAIKSVNYIETNFNFGDRIQPNYTLGGKAASLCSNIAEQNFLVENEYKIFEQCLKSNQSDTLFFLTGDSHSFHFLSAFDNSEIIQDLYFVEIPRQTIVSEKHQAFNQQRADEVLNRQVLQLQSLKRRYREIIYVTSFFLSPWDTELVVTKQRLEKYIEALSPYATLVFIAPTPVFPTGPESCVLLGKHCEVEKKTDMERRSSTNDMLLELAKAYDGVYVYDAYMRSARMMCVRYMILRKIS